MDHPAIGRSRLDAMLIYEPIHRPFSMGGCNFPRARILAACETPDNAQRLVWHEFATDLYILNYKNHIDIIGIVANKDPLRVIFAFEVYPDLCDTPLEELSPLRIVELLAERFGLMVGIGGRTGRFFFEEEISLPPEPIHGNYRSQLFDLNNPDNHPYVLPAVAGREALVARVALGFCIDLAEYKDWTTTR
jgi:hypothetical protein